MMTMTQWWAPTTVRISGDSSMRGQLVKTTDGGVLCDFPDRLVLIANHQIYTDWLYLWWIGYSAGMHGRIFVVLKESLKRIPVIGWGMQFAQFIFLKRNWEQDKPGLAKHMQNLNKSNDPMWLMLFPEGTNLASCTREKSKKWAEKNKIKDMKHTLLPRSTGLHFMLQNLRENVEYVYDCTIAYEGVPHGTFAQDVFTVGASYFGGRPPKSVNMYWRRFRVDSIPLDDPRKFELWLRLRWREKDKFIDHYLRTGRFPADTGSNNNHKGESLHGAGHIEAEVRPKYWYEFLQVFAPIGLFALVLYLFYGALPQEMINKIKSVDQKTAMKHIEAIQRGEIKVPETQELIAHAPKDLQDKFNTFQTFAASQNTSAEKVIAEAKKTLPAGALPAGDRGPAPKLGPKTTGKTPAPSDKSLKDPKISSKLDSKSSVKTDNASKPALPPVLLKNLQAQRLDSKSAKPQTDTHTAAEPSLPPVLLKNLQTKRLDSKSSKPLPSTTDTKKPAAKTVGQSQPPRLTGNGKTEPAKPVPSVKSNIQPQKPASAKSSKDASPRKSNPAGSGKAASSPKQIPDGSNASTLQKNDNQPNADAVRHAIKKEARVGKQEPKRKIRRAMQAS